MSLSFVPIPVHSLSSCVIFWNHFWYAIFMWSFYWGILRAFESLVALSPFSYKYRPEHLPSFCGCSVHSIFPFWINPCYFPTPESHGSSIIYFGRSLSLVSLYVSNISAFQFSHVFNGVQVVEATCIGRSVFIFWPCRARDETRILSPVAISNINITCRCIMHLFSYSGSS